MTMEAEVQYRLVLLSFPGTLEVTMKESPDGISSFLWSILGGDDSGRTRLVGRRPDWSDQDLVSPFPWSDWDRTVLFVVQLEPDLTWGCWCRVTRGLAPWTLANTSWVLGGFESTSHFYFHFLIFII